MLIYLLKFSACLAIFMVFYKLFLERENMHHMKRYYLLAALILSLCFPLVTFVQYVEPAITKSFVQPMDSFVSVTEIEEAAIPTNYTPAILWSFYSLGVLIFGLKFSINLFQILKKIQRNPKFKNQSFINVLLTDLITPHTFFSYIFLNKQKYESQEIPQEVFIHEQTHAKQKHSIDVLFIELLQVVFWFNPLLYFIKKDIKLNHEFLADQAVLNNGIQPSAYQKLLLAFSSDAQNLELANAINYSSIKKRFTVMKTHTSKQKIWLRSLLLLPLFALTLYGFCETKEVEKQSITIREVDISNSKDNPILEIEDNLNIFQLNGMDTSLSELKNDFIKATNNEKSDLDIKTTGGIDMNLINQIMNELKGHLININLNDDAFIIDDTDYLPNASSESRVPEETLPSINGIACDKCGVEMTEASLRSMVFSTNTNEKIISFKYKIPKQPTFSINGNQFTENAIQKFMRFNDKNAAITVFDMRTEQGLLNSHLYIKIKADSKTIQEKATPEEVAEYNKLAKHYNSQTDDNRVLKLKDMRRLRELYDKMSKDQRANAEPLPNFPPPPPPPPATSKESPQVVQMHDLPPPPPIPANATLEQKKKYQSAIDNYNSQKEGYTYKHKNEEGKMVDVVVIPEAGDMVPPPPPPPKSPLDHVIEMAKKGAFFYYEGQPVSSDKAIELLKENIELNISTKQMDLNEPKVYISKEPIVINKQTKSDEPVMLNGKKSKDGTFKLKKDKLDTIELTIAKGTITSFKFKIPGKPTMSIKGNKLNDEAKALLLETPDATSAQLLDIKNSNNAVHTPIFIYIK